MADAPPARPGLFSGLAKILHLHQLPQPPHSPPPSSRANSPIPSPRTPIAPLAAVPAPTISPEKPRAAISREAAPASFSTRMPIPSVASPPSRAPGTLSPAPTTRSASPGSGLSSMGNTHPKWMTPQHSASNSSNSSSTKKIIITDYDRILDLVKARHPIKLDEIARMLALKEELVAQELQTLEDNGLVEVKYPAFGEPLIYFKTPEA